MRVSELIEKLKEYNQNMIVVISSDGNYQGVDDALFLVDVIESKGKYYEAVGRSDKSKIIKVVCI